MDNLADQEHRCRLTRNLSESTEGVIILYLGTSDLSFSYVPCSRR